MSPREWRLRIEDMLESIAAIQRYVSEIDATGFTRGTTVFDAVLYNLVVIGEAASHVPDDVTSRYPEIEWRGIRGMRHILAHEYFGASVDVVWKTVVDDLPTLRVQLKRVLEE